jgi:hypothetical protein
MPDVGFPSAHHEETIRVAVDDLFGTVETALTELGWGASRDEKDEYGQFFQPNDTWWKQRWKEGKVKVVPPETVIVEIHKFVLLDVVDWNDGCQKLCAAFREKLFEVAQRKGGTIYR